MIECVRELLIYNVVIVKIKHADMLGQFSYPCFHTKQCFNVTNIS